MMILMIMRRRKATENEKREVLRLLMMSDGNGGNNCDDVNENAGEGNFDDRVSPLNIPRFQQMERNKRRREAKEKDYSSLSSIR